MCVSVCACVRGLCMGACRKPTMLYDSHLNLHLTKIQLMNENKESYGHIHQNLTKLSWYIRAMYFMLSFRGVRYQLDCEIHVKCMKICAFQCIKSLKMWFCNVQKVWNQIKIWTLTSLVFKLPTRLKTFHEYCFWCGILQAAKNISVTTYRIPPLVLQGIRQKISAMQRLLYLTIVLG